MDHQLQNALNRLEQRLNLWRQCNSAPTPIPSEIWRKAGELASQLGVASVSKALRLDYSRLKKLSLGELGSARPTALGPSSGRLPTFVELQPIAMDGMGKCVVEVESSRGARMRIQMESPQCSSLVALIREFVA